MADFDRYDNGSGGGGFVMGLLAGTVLGAGLGMLLAPKAGSELRGAIGEQARNFGNKASEQYRRATDSASTWAEKGREFVNQAREAVSRGAEEARGFASGTTGSSYSGGTGSSGSNWSGTTGSTSSPGSSSFGNDRGTGSSTSGNYGQS